MANHLSLREQVYHFLGREMQTGRLAPGASLNMNEISRKLGISKTPLRDALIQLETEGFVTILPRRGVVVNKLTLHEVKSYYEILGALESSALLSAFNQITPALIDRMEQSNAEQENALRQGRFEQYYRLNLDFHDLFLNLSGNEIIKKLLIPIKRRLYDFPRRDYIIEWEMINIDEHNRLIVCIKKGNPTGAASIIKDEHWNFNYHCQYLKKYYNLQNGALRINHQGEKHEITGRI